ncbi:hypothetical protein LUZ60_016707 [Juncus effusus]|nr:hypothetical protein LUZ60_016707 [Juncus effusus]
MQQQSCQNDWAWAGIPPDLIHLISTKFTEITDLVSFRAVCKNWRASACLDNSPNQLPWLLKSCYSEPDLYYSFYSSSFEPHTFHVPELSKKSLLESSCDGYIITYDSDSHNSSAFLFNPRTKKKVQLPPLIANRCHPVHIGKEKIVIIGSFNSSKEDCDFLGTLTRGKSSWFWNFLGPYERYGHLYRDRRCYIYRKDGHIEILDTTTYDVVLKVPYLGLSRPTICDRRGGNNSLVVLDNEILQVYHMHYIDLEIEQCYFDIHRLELLGNGGFRWVRVNDIGNNVLFADSTRVFARKASDCDQYKGNGIYFVKIDFDGADEDCQPMYCFLLGRYDIEEGRAEWLPDMYFKSVDPPNTWFVPTLN